jgi:transcriptional regulator with XRE-family HTH domain
MKRADGPNPIDVHVGGRVRIRRAQRGLSQGKLAEGVGLTFQQVQKYERGANRISASKLFEMGRVLEVPVSYFFDGLPGSGNGQTPERDALEAMLNDPDGAALVKAFLGISRPGVRKALAEIAHEIAEYDGHF